MASLIPPGWQLLVGLLSAYGPMKMLWLAAAGEPYGGYAVAGLVVNLAALALLVKRFNKVVHR